MIKELGTDRLKRTNQMSPWCISGGSSWFNTQAVTSKGSFRSSKWPAEPCRESKDGSKDSAGDCTCVVEKAGLSRPLKFWTRLGDGEVNQRCRCKKEEHPSKLQAYSSKTGKRPVKEQGHFDLATKEMPFRTESKGATCTRQGMLRQVGLDIRICEFLPQPDSWSLFWWFDVM